MLGFTLRCRLPDRMHGLLGEARTSTACFPEDLPDWTAPGSRIGIVTTFRPTSVSGHIPDSTPLAEAFYFVGSREWYLTLRANQVSGLITYWAFNSREFRLQLLAGLSRV